MAGIFGTKRLRLWQRCGVAVLVTLAAWIATYLLRPELQADAPVIFFPLAVVCSAYLAGPLGGLISTAMGALVAAYSFLPPEGFGVSRFHDQVRLALFVFLGGGVSLLAEALERWRHRAEAKGQALSESEDRLLMAAEAADVGTWYWDVRTGALTWSDRCKALFGLPPESPVSMETFVDRVHPDDRAAVQKAYERALAEHKDYDVEFRAVRPDGSIRWILAKGRGLYDLAGRAVRMHGIAMDITQRKQVVEQLRLLNETLEQRVAERTAVARERARQLQVLARELTQAEQRERRRLAGILHDHLQQLLVGARFNVNLVQSHLQTAELRQPISQIDSMLQQSLEVSRTLTAELDPPVLNQGGLLEALEWLAGWMRDKHGLQVDLRTDGPIESQPREVSLPLFQSVRELLLNIRKHAQVNRAEVAISQPDRDRVRIVVRDDGVGFDPLKVQSLARPDGGFGLPSVRERLELLDGRLEVDSKPGAGTRVVLEAPLHLHDERPQAGVDGQLAGSSSSA
jgi:PAS domain S-box-containing protein